MSSGNAGTGGDAHADDYYGGTVTLRDDTSDGKVPYPETPGEFRAIMDGIDAGTIDPTTYGGMTSTIHEANADGITTIVEMYNTGISKPGTNKYDITPYNFTTFLLYVESIMSI